MKRRLRIGLVYDLLGSAPAGPPPAPLDWDAEYEPIETVEALEGAIRRAGHEPVRLGSPRELVSALGRGSLPKLDAAWNIAEGWGTRNREAWAPVLLEMSGIPALGSDALTLSTSLDKAWTLDLVRAAGVPVAGHVSAESVEALSGLTLPGPFPLFVKPRWEGTAKGITSASRAPDAAALARAVERVVETYGQPALIEPFLPGAEYTVTLIGNAPPRALPVLQRALEADSGIGLHALERHGPAGGHTHVLPGTLTPVLEAALADAAVRAFEALRCRDFARADFRLDASGAPRFLELNPLPTFARDGSFAVLAELMGRDFEELLAEVLAHGLRRLGLP
jgi:D-alanine-D-alanine ligase